jgi:glycosyltransferase involved in cell wall biosynthesis
VVVDDGSTDATLRVAREYAASDPRIVCASKENGGTSSARNVAAGIASAPLFALLDQDDYYLPEYFEKMGRFIDEHPDFEIYSCNAYHSYGDGPLVPRHDPAGAVRSFTLDDMLQGCRILPQAVFRREVFDLVGGFDEDRRCWTEDYDFWLRAMVLGARHIYDPEPLAVYRWSPSQKSSSDVACAGSDAYILDKLVRSGTLTGKRLRTAKRRAYLQARAVTALADPVRRDLQRRLLSGNFREARSLYLRSRRGWADPVRYALALPVMMVSPRLFARLFMARRERQEAELR